MSDGMVVRKPGFRIGASLRVSFSSDGATLATLGKRVTKWNVAARRRAGAVHPFPHESHIDISPDGTRIAVKNTLGDVAVLRTDTLGEVLRLPGGEYGEGSDIRFSPCSRFVIDGSWNGDLLVRDVASGALVLHERGDRITKLASTSDRLTWLYGRGESLMLRSWPFSERDERVLPGRWLSHGSALAISNDGSFVATMGVDGIETWRLHDGDLEPVAACSVPVSGTGDQVAWNPWGTALAYAGGGRALVLTADLQALWSAPFRYASDVAFSAKGDLLAIGDWSRGAVLELAGHG